MYHFRWVLIRDPKCSFDSRALLFSDANFSASEIVSTVVHRWTMETTFHETKTHLGVEGKRQWNELSIARSTPLRLKLFSLVALIANPNDH